MSIKVGNRVCLASGGEILSAPQKRRMLLASKSEQLKLIELGACPNPDYRALFSNHKSVRITFQKYMSQITYFGYYKHLYTRTDTDLHGLASLNACMFIKKNTEQTAKLYMMPCMMPCTCSHNAHSHRSV